jgi:hypothetical protein
MTIGFSAKPELSTIQLANGGAAHSHDRTDSVREAPVPWVRRRIEDVGQTGSQVAGGQPAKDLQEEMLGALLLGPGEREAASGEGADDLMGSSI